MAIASQVGNAAAGGRDVTQNFLCWRGPPLVEVGNAAENVRVKCLRI